MLPCMAMRQCSHDQQPNTFPREAQRMLVQPLRIHYSTCPPKSNAVAMAQRAFHAVMQQWGQASAIGVWQAL